MGHGIDICLGDAREATSLEESLEADFVRCLVCQAGLVMTGEKPAAVFGFRPRAHREEAASRRGRSLAGRMLSVYMRRVAAFGMRVSWLGWRGDSLMLLVWRPARVRELLAGPASRLFLERRGLPAEEGRLMPALAARLRACYAGRTPFPHEIGLVLGYPIEDVEGFIADGGRGAAACGRWKVYGDVRAARLRFDELGRRERQLRRLYSEGVPVRELLRMGMARS